jgi:hypothetical protein
MPGRAEQEPEVVALAISGGGYLVYVLEDGSECHSMIKVEGNPGDRFPITPRRLGVHERNRNLSMANS